MKKVQHMKKLLIPALLFITGGLMMATTYRRIKAPTQLKQVYVDTTHQVVRPKIL